MGGAVRAIEEGFQQSEIQDESYTYQRAVERGEQVIVGVNRFTMEEEPPEGLLRIDPAVEQEQKQRLADFKAGKLTDEAKAATEELAADLAKQFA